MSSSKKGAVSLWTPLVIALQASGAAADARARLPENPRRCDATGMDAWCTPISHPLRHPAIAHAVCVARYALATPWMS
ncbi:hypothetical protein [Xanthomonas vesicatoria]|uniref:hypothetical protein n=1 Tax=Xanthomonas vesicatoria TaxID=56460 RepID=UPI0013DEC43F|nr:hypothetical protein [Xanthomonas vesicatoria]MCC8618674.1 hypothetical protein [Xanthomonas vesicatoria]